MEIASFVPEYFYLDGGAMFGAVPKTLWSRAIAADSENRIRLACRMLYVEIGARRILVDLGCGTKWSDKQQQIYRFEPQLRGSLAERFPGVTDVILTHLHFDHCGGVSFRDQDGELKLSFPDATHHVQERHWHHAHAPGPRERATFFADNLEPLARARLNLLSSEAVVAPGVRVFVANGHTPALQWVQLGDGADAVLFASELVPTVHHLPLPYVMGYDLCAETTIAEKTEFLERAVRDDCTLVFDHDPVIAAGKVGKNEAGRFQLREQVRLPALTP